MSKKFLTLPKNIAPTMRPSRKDHSFSNPCVSGAILVSGRVMANKTNMLLTRWESLANAFQTFCHSNMFFFDDSHTDCAESKCYSNIFRTTYQEMHEKKQYLP